MSYCRSRNFHVGKSLQSKFLCILFSPPVKAAKIFTVCNYDLDLTHVKFQNCGALEVTATLASEYHEHTNFCGHNISWVKFLRGLIFMGTCPPPQLRLLIFCAYKSSWV